MTLGTVTTATSVRMMPAMRMLVKIPTTLMLAIRIRILGSFIARLVRRVLVGHAGVVQLGIVTIAWIVLTTRATKVLTSVTTMLMMPIAWVGCIVTERGHATLPSIVRLDRPPVLVSRVGKHLIRSVTAMFQSRLPLVLVVVGHLVVTIQEQL
jgi:hypothetical protein